MFKFLFIFFLFFTFAKADIKGAGATFVYKAVKELAIDYKDKFGKKVDFTPIGSSGGIKELKRGDVNFAISEIKGNCENCEFSQFAKGNVAVIYNVKDVKHLNLNGKILAEIYLGKIEFWDDEKIKILNQDENLPHEKISIFHRYDGSGTTLAFSEFLSANDKKFSEILGSGFSLNFKVGIGKKGSYIIAQSVRDTPFSIGYTGESYAVNLKSANLVVNDEILTIENKKYPITNKSYFVYKKDGEKLDEILKFIEFIRENGEVLDKYSLSF